MSFTLKEMPDELAKDSAMKLAGELGFQSLLLDNGNIVICREKPWWEVKKEELHLSRYLNGYLRIKETSVPALLCWEVISTHSFCATPIETYKTLLIIKNGG